MAYKNPHTPANDQMAYLSKLFNLVGFDPMDYVGTSGVQTDPQSGLVINQPTVYGGYATVDPNTGVPMDPSQGGGGGAGGGSGGGGSSNTAKFRYLYQGTAPMSQAAQGIMNSLEKGVPLGDVLKQIQDGQEVMKQSGVDVGSMTSLANNYASALYSDMSSGGVKPKQIDLGAQYRQANDRTYAGGFLAGNKGPNDNGLGGDPFGGNIDPSQVFQQLQQQGDQLAAQVPMQQRMVQAPPPHNLMSAMPMTQQQDYQNKSMSIHSQAPQGTPQPYYEDRPIATHDQQQQVKWDSILQGLQQMQHQQQQNQMAGNNLQQRMAMLHMLGII